FPDVVNLRQNGGLSFQRFVGFKIDFKKSEIRERVQAGRTGRDQSFFIPDVTVENRRAAFAQNGGKDLQSAGIVGEHTRSVLAKTHMDLFDRASLPAITELFLFGLNGTGIALERSVIRRRAT